MVHPKPKEEYRGTVFQLRRFKRLHPIFFSKRSTWTVVVGGLILACMAWPHPVPAQILKLQPDQMLEADDQLPWVLEADEVSYDQQLDQYIARGNVQISKGDKRLTADYIQYDHLAQRAIARGNVVLTIGQDILSGSSIELDLESQKGLIENATLFLEENNFHITADKIEKTGELTYRMEEATLTTCDGPKPSWQISARNVKIKSDGAGTAKHAVLRARKVPVLYTPFFYYPARTDRQSGFLMPQFGETQRKGYYYTQPFFWAISESSDATFYADYMRTRGIKPGAEFRYILNENSRGTFMLDGFRDRKIDDGGDSSDRYGWRDAGEDVLRTNEDRYWFRMSHHQPVPLGFFAKLDLDIASDQDYLRFFREGYMSYGDTNDHFLKAFNRQLDDYNDPVRTNRLNLNRLWPKFSFNFEPRWNDDTRRDSNTRNTLQRLPFMSFDGEKQNILTSPFYFDLESQYDYFWRDSGSRGQRIDVHPRLYLPFRINKYATIEPSVGYRQTLYRLDQRNFDDLPDTDQWSHRELFDTRLELFTEIERIFNLEGQLFERMKHRIRPQITHEFIADSKQRDLPRFDALDRIDETNKITYSLINTLTSKSKGVKTKKPEPELAASRGALRQTAVDYRYNDFFRFAVQQSYDFEGANRSFSPITAKLDLYPGNYVSIDADAQYSIYENEFVGHNVQGTLWDNRGDELYVDYRFERASEETNNLRDINSITAKLKLQVIDSVSVYVGHEHNFETDQRIRTRAGFTYTAQCWGLDFDYINDPNDWQFGFKIRLMGLGEFAYK